MTDRHVGAGQTYATIQAAINVSVPYDVIIVHAGTYFEQLYSLVQDLTIKNNPGDTPEVTGGIPISDRTNPSSGVLPAGSWVPWVSTPSGYGVSEGAGASYKYSPLVYLNADRTVWSGINIKECAGRAIQFGNNKQRYTNCILENSEIYNNRGSGIQLTKQDNMIVRGCEIHHNVNFYLGDETNSGHNQPGMISISDVLDLLFEDCNIYYNGGEIFGLNTHDNTGSSRITVRNCQVSDGKEVLFYFHGCEDVHVESCVFYVSEDRDEWKADLEIGFNGITMIPLELASYEWPSGYKFCGTQNIKFLNNLVVNTGYNYMFAGGSLPCGSYYKNIEIKGNTFVQTKGGGQISISSPDIVENVVIDGNIFHTSGEGSMPYGGWPPGVTWTNNLWNRQPHSDVFGAGSIVGDPKLKNPSAIIRQNAIDVDNYKIETGSAAIDQWITDLVEDYFGSIRTTPSDLGFHDLEATGGEGGEEVPNAAFTLTAESVEIGTEVTAQDISTPSPGETITDIAWSITLPGTSEGATGTLPSIVYTPLVAGDYVYRLFVTQTNGGESVIYRTVKAINPDDIIPPQPPQPPLNCELGVWNSAVRSGVPGFAIIDDVYSIECYSDAQGMYYSWWESAVSIGDELKLSADVHADLASGNGTLFALFYDSANQLLSGESVNLNQNADFANVELLCTVPAQTVKVRMDIRLWNGAGTLLFKNACIIDVADETPVIPAAYIDASISGTAISDNAFVDLDDTIDFTGEGSFYADSYKWQQYKWIDGIYTLFRDPLYTEEIAVLVDDIGAFYIELIVTSSTGNESTKLFYFTVITPDNPIEVWFDVQQISSAGIPATGIIIGDAPLTVLFTPRSSSEDLEVIGHTWEILNDQHETIDMIGSTDDILLTFPHKPLGLVDGDIVDYGMRLTTTFEGYHGVEHVEYLVVSVTIATEEQIGPSIPATISPITDNVIQDDGSHKHAVLTSADGEPNTFPIADNLGVFFQHFLAAGYKAPVLGAPHNPYSASFDQGIVFKRSALLTAPEIILDVLSLVLDKLPKTNPNSQGAVWVDENHKLSVSQGPAPAAEYEEIIQVAASVNDANEAAIGTVNLTNHLLNLEAAIYWEVIAFRFTDVQIPPGAIITNVSLETNIYDTGLVYNADVSFEDVDNAAQFTTVPNNLSTRARTAADEIRKTVAVGQVDTVLSNAMLQQVIDKPGWALGNAVVVLLDIATGADLAIHSYDSNPSDAATLTINYIA